ncbi:MAG TPA: rRNA adenine dimethyltransferase family protein, partial [Wenzhouxiangellaceae bacterium]|nr:rRNA adenine dimethyltransferase family protein [Wenzhouxiangellaceae bacterium]
FMLQKEVVDRLAAIPGNKAWGRLGVMTQARANVTMLFRVPPGAFTPAPKVESAVVRIVPRALSEKQRAMLPFLEKVVRAAFGQRRKTLRNTLKGVLDEQELQALNIEPGRRAETLSLAEFDRMAERVRKREDKP